MAELLDNMVRLGHAFVLLMSPTLLLLLCFGMFLGIVAGALPGVTMVMCVTLCLPFTYGLEIGEAIIFLFSIYCGGVYGGSIISIVFNIPGDPMNAATCFDGHPMAKKGQGGLALGMALTASTIGGFFSAVTMVLFSTLLASWALKFSSVEFFAVIFLGLMGVAVIETDKGMFNSIISILIGLFISTVGVESITGMARYTFGTQFLMGGINWIVVLLGMFAVGEVLDMYAREEEYGDQAANRKERAQMPSLRLLWSLKWTFLRNFIVGNMTGAMPGAGATVASFIGYGLERQMSKHPEKFGTGCVEGVAAPETANNASTGSAMIPLLALGIPGSAATAIMLGAFMVHGIQPGPMLFEKKPDYLYTIYAGSLLINLIMFVIGWFSIRIMIRLMDVPKHIMAVFIMIFACFGSYSLKSSMVDVWIMVFAGIFGYIMRVTKFPTTPLILGLILGPMGEDFFMTAMYHHSSDLLIFFKRPVSLALMLGAFFLTALPYLRRWWARWMSRGLRGAAGS